MMELVIDANVVISALVSSAGKTKELIFSPEIKLFAPEFLTEEIRKHEAEILEKSGLSKTEFEIALTMISSQIEFIPWEEFSDFIRTVEAVSPDCNDNEYLALALKKKCPLWSNDKVLKKQKKVKILSTEELVELLSENLV